MITVGATAPSYITIDPSTGLVNADFSGHIKGSGVDLQASPIVNPPAINQVRWIRDTDGSTAGWIAVQESNGGPGAYMQIEADSNGQPSDLVLIAKETASGNRTLIQLQQNSVSSGITGFVNETIPFTILDANKKSSFVQLLGAIQSEFIQWGSVTGLSLNSTNTPTAPGATVVSLGSLGGTAFPTQIDSIVGHVEAGNAWPTYYALQPGFLNGDGGNNVRIQLVSASAGSPILMTVHWIAIGH